MILFVTSTDSLEKMSTVIEVTQNIGTIEITCYLSTCASHVVMATDESIRFGLTNKVHHVKLSLKSKSVLY